MPQKKNNHNALKICDLLATRLKPFGCHDDSASGPNVAHRVRHRRDGLLIERVVRVAMMVSIAAAIAPSVCKPSVMLAFAQLERDTMIERTRAGLAAAAATGRKGVSLEHSVTSTEHRDESLTRCAYAVPTLCLQLQITLVNYRDAFSQLVTLSTR